MLKLRNYNLNPQLYWFCAFLIMANRLANAVTNNNTVKLVFNPTRFEIKPSTTGPMRKPTKPIPETKAIPADGEMFFVFPAIRNNSGIITDKPKPRIPNPTTEMYRFPDRIPR